MITRGDIEGTLARWFAIDADSRIAVFTGPYAAWPAAVFDDYPAVEAADEFVESAPPTTDAILTARWLASGASPYVNDRVREELAILVDRGFKVELDTLCGRDSRLVDYLQHKLADGDLIKL